MESEAKVLTSVCETGEVNELLQASPDDLFVSHKDVWEFIKSYWGQYKSVPSIETVKEEFPDFEPQPVKGATAFHLDRLRDDFIKTRLRNMLLTEGKNLQNLAGVDILDRIAGEVTELTRLSGAVRDLDLTDYERAAQDLRERAERAEAMGGMPGIPTGIDAFDQAYPTGLAAGHLVVIIGWSGFGKTLLSTYLACKAWEQGFKPMIVSLEMSPEQMRDRIYTLMASGMFRNSDFSRGSIDIDSFQDWSQKRFSKSQNFIVTSSEGMDSVTPNVVQAKINQHRPSLVICDYQQLFDDNQHSRSEVERNRRVSRQFKQLATRNQIPVINLSQATQEDPSDLDDPPLIEQVAWSKGIQHDADLAIAAHKPRDGGLMEIVSRKNRHGGEFAFYLDWDVDNGIVKEV